MKTAWNLREYKSRFKVMAICEGKRPAIVLVVVTWRFYVYMTHLHRLNDGRLCGLTGSVLDHRSLKPEFVSGRGHIWRMFHLWLRFITLGGRSAHLAYHVHKSGRKTSIIIIHSLTVAPVGHGTMLMEFKCPLVWRMFHPSFGLIVFEKHPAYLACRVVWIKVAEKQ